MNAGLWEICEEDHLIVEPKFLPPIAITFDQTFLK